MSVHPFNMEQQEMEQIERRGAARSHDNLMVEDDDEVDPDLQYTGCCMGIVMIFVTIFLFPLSIFILIGMFRPVPEYERAVIFRTGKLLYKKKAKGPGLVFVMPCIDEIKTVDIRTIIADVPEQAIFTEDSVNANVNAIVFFKIFDPVKSLVEVENLRYSVGLQASSSLRNILGNYKLPDILTSRDEINNTLLNELDEITDPWGVQIERVEIRDIRLPPDMVRNMAAEAEASREARARMLIADGEQKASVALKNAADIMSGSAATVQLRYLQTIKDITNNKTEVVVMPLPLDIVSKIAKRG